MPTVDMPLEEMKTYMGSTPRPDDFDEFWDKSLEEMRAIDPQVELVPSDFKCPYAECYDMYFTGTFNTRIHAKLIKPKNISTPSPAVLHFHGYSGASGGWVCYLPYAAAGMTVAALDCRGQAGLSNDNCPVSGNTLYGFITKGLLDEPQKMYYRNTFLDTAQLAKIVMELPYVDENRIGAFGGSQGGGLTVACAALEPRIKKAVAQFPFLSDYKRVWDMDLDVDAYTDLRQFFRQRDPRHEHENEFFTKLGYTDIQNLAPRIKADLLMFTGLMDNIVPPSTQFAAYNKMTCNKKMYIYHDYGHEGYPEFEEIAFTHFMTL